MVWHPGFTIPTPNEFDEDVGSGSAVPGPVDGGSHTLQLRRDTAAGWASDDPVLAAGEPGEESDTGRMKIGNGTDSWNDRPYVGSGYTLDYSLIEGTNWTSPTPASHTTIPGLNTGFIQPPQHLVLTDVDVSVNGDVAAAVISVTLRRSINGGAYDTRMAEDYVAEGGLTSWGNLHLRDITSGIAAGSTVDYDVTVARISGTGNISLIGDVFGFGGLQSLITSVMI